MINRYNLSFPDNTTPATIELYCFANDWAEDKGGLGRFEHLRNATDLLLNNNGAKHFIWNEWSEWMLREFCYNREVGVAGPGASWKSTCMAWYGLARFYGRPNRTRGIFTSTTLEGLRSRIWKEVLRLYRASGMPFGKPINHPHPKIQFQKGDDGFGLFGIAVEAGDVEKAVENIKGRHAPDTFVGVDEMTGVSAAIVDAGANLEKGCDWFQMVGIANPVSYFDQHGLFCEPEGGWSSINVEQEKWKTKRGGACLHLDGLKAPNVLAGKKRYPGMLSLDDVEISRQRDGENSPKFWSQTRGFWPPEGISKTVLTATIIEKFSAREKAIWVESPLEFAACDPAFEGGDRRVLRFASLGKIDNTNHKVLCFSETLLLKIDVTRKDDPIHYQLARQIREECKARGVDPSNFALDTSGEGGGLASILKREWNPDFLEVEFGGVASDRMISDINPRRGKEEYVNRVSELWYQFRGAVERNQIRGLDVDTCNEFTERRYDLRGPRILVEPKREMKLRTGKSPDLADACVVMLELVLDHGLIRSEAQDSARSQSNKWIKFVREMTPHSNYARVA